MRKPVPGVSFCNVPAVYPKVANGTAFANGFCQGLRVACGLPEDPESVITYPSDAVTDWNFGYEEGQRIVISDSDELLPACIVGLGGGGVYSWRKQDSNGLVIKPFEVRDLFERE